MVRFQDLYNYNSQYGVFVVVVTDPSMCYVVADDL